MGTQINLHSVTSKTTPAAQETKCATCKHLYSYLTTVDFCDQFTQKTLERNGRYIVLACDGYEPSDEAKPDA
jgi:hypothetical protein